MVRRVEVAGGITWSWKITTTHVTVDSVASRVRNRQSPVVEIEHV